MSAFSLFIDSVLARYTYFELLKEELRMQQTIHSARFNINGNIKTRARYGTSRLCRARVKAPLPGAGAVMLPPRAQKKEEGAETAIGSVETIFPFRAWV
jgi:hypothetical protein